MNRRTSLPYVALAAFVFALVVLLQWRSGAYSAEFGAHPDEAAHYVTGLMVRDYLLHGIPGNPMAFAQRYYDHYPKVALGNWPPGFYAIQAVWTAAFTPARASILLLMAVLTAITALAVAVAVRREFGWAAACFGAVLFAVFNTTQQFSSMVMTEIPVALFSTLAVLSFGRYLDHQRPRDSIAFGLFASAAILTKGSGIVLALVPPLAILLTGRFDVVRRASFWYAVPLVLVLAGPWTYMFRDIARAGWEEPTISLRYTQDAVTYFPRHLLLAASPIVTVLALIGAAFTLHLVRVRQASAVWAAAAALVFSTLLFHMIVPASLDYRHLTQALPAWAMAATAGVVAVYRALLVRSPRLTWVVLIVAAIGLAHTASNLTTKRGRGFGAVVEQIVERREYTQSRFMIASDATGEGMFIAEAAMRGAEPIIKRGSKMLAQQEWHGGNYTAKVHSAADVFAELAKERIRFVVFDDSNPNTFETAHTRVLRETAESAPDRLARIATYPVVRTYPPQVRDRSYPTGISVYEVRDTVANSRDSAFSALQPAGGAR